MKIMSFLFVSIILCMLGYYRGYHIGFVEGRLHEKAKRYK